MSIKHSIRLDKNGNLCTIDSEPAINLILTIPEMEEVRQSYYEQYSMEKDTYYLNASKALWNYLNESYSKEKIS